MPHPGRPAYGTQFPPNKTSKGLQRGADDYINKPFNAKVLLARCNNLVRNRIILQKKFSQQKNFDAQSLASNPIDQKFLDTVNSIIEKNLDNIDFDMNMMARELGLSRSFLICKIQGIDRYDSKRLCPQLQTEAGRSHVDG